MKFSTIANDYVGAQATLVDVTPATHANVPTKVYANNNNTGVERKATITMTRADYSTVTIEVIQASVEVLLSLSEANCYIINDAGVYMLDATKKGNGQQVGLLAGCNTATLLLLFRSTRLT